MDLRSRTLLEAAARPYIDTGRYWWHFARNKLRYDPVFLALMRRRLFPDRGTLFDLGCGQGILLALLIAAREQFQRGEWPRGWPAPPLNLELRGIKLHRDRVRIARRVLADRARVDHYDARDFDFPPCSVIVILDVLLYLGVDEQQRLLEKAEHALDSGGLLLMREADAGGGLAFQVTRWSERLMEAGRGHLRNRLHYRSAAEWTGVLEKLGLAVSAEPMSQGTPFANILFVARKVPQPD